MTEYQWGDMSDYPVQKEKGSKEYDEYIRLHANEIIFGGVDQRTQLKLFILLLFLPNN